MNHTQINFQEKFTKISDQWTPRVIAEMNDNQFKIAKIEGEFVWHKHEETDEVFIIVEGSMNLEFRDGTVNLQEGEMFVVPKGVEHKPVAKNECKILMIETKGTTNTGNVGGERTQEGDIWV